ncbi:AraC family transcriptional regulator [Thiohalobacter thiocyanaticus]|uniref:AraC family transcriptional regulator n=1 Tax=Thiohalobacter thiocyanaticus TaxID=585455 RepID=A0A426QIJ1_9GAMM|nr:AraC family transcriptional regulator [Thiohalobacter thiocyanaticus]RRQ21582.1 AraC family transcriptional regulator [Thiohalobacter thiocyanaticus]
MSYRSGEDLLSTVLAGFKLRAHVFEHATYCGNWSLNTSGSQRATFHLIGRGSAWLRLDTAQPDIPLRSGDLVVLPHDAWHTLSGWPEARTPHSECGEDTGTVVMCGYIDFGAGPANPVLDALPEILVVRSENTEASSRIDQLARLMLAEAEQRAPGWQVAVDRLADTLFVQVIRHHLHHQEQPRGWLAALADPRLNLALSAMHRSPGEAWSVERLARTAGMSRTAFAQHFVRLVGQTPMGYLSDLRMREADRLLRDPNRSVARVAEQMGYSTEAAFRKAFKRVWGVGPGAQRRNQTTRA